MAQLGGRIFAGFFAALFLLSSCAVAVAYIIAQHQSSTSTTSPSSSSNQSQEKKVDNKLQGTQLASFTPTTQAFTQLQTTDTTPGTGATVKAGDTITVDYTGAVANTGKIFQSSKDTGQPATFALNQVIAGWSQGIPGMKVGGTRRLLIPAALAYGSNPPQGSGIPANADLVFDVTVHSDSTQSKSK
ncbi:MAG TPA: FKBP-type peptidyl-prolyl cis-trans isomerase [Candidatus Saccharimonadales bacterium]|nr:FKBP-type peptidyl-prolyl cis-trans isomerase [Candidatus Saccharimonadales bacterium]